MIRRLSLLLMLVAALGLAACGQESNEEGEYQSESAQLAETEGIYVDVDELKYQVQVSKQLNPLLTDDKAYLMGLNDLGRELGPDEEWFGVWMLVQNYGEEAIQSADEFIVVDTQENEYRPVFLGEDNIWAYRAKRLEPKETLPGSNEPARERQPNGSLLLFKLKRQSLDNRPLELVIRGDSGEQAIVNLDV
jgi:hypothetical protein